MKHDDVTEALDICAGIMKDADDLPEKYEEFADSVSDFAISLTEFIERNDRVTERQLAALNNIRRGLDRIMREW